MTMADIGLRVAMTGLVGYGLVLFFGADTTESRPHLRQVCKAVRAVMLTMFAAGWLLLIWGTP